MAKEKLDTQLNIKMSSEEKATIFKKSKEAGLSASAFIKLMALKGEVSVVKAREGRKC